MIIKQRRIKSIGRHFKYLDKAQNLVIGLRDLDRFETEIEQLGFARPFTPGELLLPPRIFGPISNFNSEGKYHVHRDRPMETAYRMIEWHWTEFRGRYDTEEMSDYVDVPYKRYPRTFIEPPSVEFSLANDAAGSLILIAEEIAFTQENYDRIIHTVNLFLEIFGECEVLTQDLEGFVIPEIRRLHWEILPPGRYPWERLQRLVNEIVREAREGNWALIENRFETINSFSPEFHAIGRLGFRGYVVFGFPEKGLYVFESTITGNATYVFDDNWENLSKLTKSEILDEHLQQHRIIHRKGWHSNIRQLLA